MIYIIYDNNHNKNKVMSTCITEFSLFLFTLQSIMYASLNTIVFDSDHSDNF